MERSDKMIGISVAVKKEWETTLNYFGMSHEECEKYPFGEYFRMMIDNQEVILYLGGVRKMNASASTQYMIDHFKFNKSVTLADALLSPARHSPARLPPPQSASRRPG